jgi:hypothetical protein
MLWKKKLPLQDRTGQDRTGQDRTGQDRTGQYPYTTHNIIEFVPSLSWQTIIIVI